MKITAFWNTKSTMFVLTLLAILFTIAPAQAGDGLITGNYSFVPRGGGMPVIIRELICRDPNCDDIITDRPVVVSRSGGSIWAGGEVNIPEGGACLFTLNIYLGFNCPIIPLDRQTIGPIDESGFVLLEVDPRRVPFTGDFSGQVINDCDTSTTPCVNVRITP